MPSRLSRLARAIVRRYPKAWRQRYEIEIAGFIEDAPAGWRDVLDLARGCVVERARAFIEPEAHPTRAWMLLGVARFVPAVAFYGLLVGLAAVLRDSVPPPPSSVQWAALLSIFPLMAVGFRTLLRAPNYPTWGPACRVPPRWGIATWLALFSLSLVVVFWSDPPGNPPSRLGWFGHDTLHWFIWPQPIRKALDLYWPAGLRLSWKLMRIGGLREQLGWARMELRRCESIGAGGVESADLVRAREEVARLERELASALADLRVRA